MNFDKLYNLLMEEKELPILKLKDFEQTAPKNFTGIAVWPDGTKEWYLKGKLHREDGPAAIYFDGTMVWAINDELHREDGPAVYYKDNHDNQYFLNGKEYSKQNWKNELVRRGIIKDPSLEDVMDAI